METLPISLRSVSRWIVFGCSQMPLQTETVFSTDQHSVSYVQVRGSVPRTFTRSAYVSLPEE